jgi:hypothetical protein
MIKEDNPQARIFVCVNEKAPEKAQCMKGEGEKCRAWLKEELVKRDLQSKIWVTRTKCQDYCEKNGTAVTFEPTHEQFSNVRVEDLPALLDEFVKKLKL